MKAYKILIADNFPNTKIYQKIIKDKFIDSEINFNFDEIYDCERYHEKIIGNNIIEYDLLLLDVHILSLLAQKKLSGQEIKLHIKHKRPNTKVIIITRFTDNYRLYDIFKNLNPDSILIKSDVDEIIFINAIEHVLEDKPYYSSTFLKLIRNQLSIPFPLDEIDRKILYLLSMGIRTQELPNHVYLSISGVEKRIRILKENFEVKGASTVNLISKVKEKKIL